MSFADTPAPPDALLRVVRRMLRPLVRLLIRSGVTFPVLADALRGLYVEVAAHDLLTDPQSRTDSRISLLTGVHRKELRRLRTQPVDPAGPPPAVTLSTQIIARWLAAAPWIDAEGQPRALARLGEDSFETLVGTVTKDVRARTVYEEWLSQGLVTLDATERVVLNQSAYLPRPGGEEQLFFFARNLHDHIAAAVANVAAQGAPPFLDRSVHYDRLDAATASRLEALAREAARRLLVEVNAEAARMTETESPDAAATHRVNLGIYLYAADETQEFGS